MNKPILVDFCLSKDITLSQIQLDQFEKFENTLYETNQTTNLTRVPQEECTVRHFIDSLLIVDLIPQNATVLDIGSGPGFPSWPLACARPDIKVLAVDSSTKMAQFLMSQQLPNLRVKITRAEEFAKREKFDVVTGRAVAPLEIQLELCAAFCKKGGIVIPFRTPNDKDQIQKQRFELLGLRLEDVIERELPTTDVMRVFPVYRKINATPAKYPRPWATIKASPLRS